MVEKKSSSNEICIIGAGIGGMDCALDLAEAGYKVHLLDAQQTIGGKFAQIYKIFPYDECSACVLTPKMCSIGNHPNINILTLIEVDEISGIEGNFHVKLTKKPRYVDETKCTGCQKCVQICPVEMDSVYDIKLGIRKAIYLDFPQQIPLVTTIDKNHCIDCRMCEKQCPVGAIDYNMQPEKIDLHVGSIVIATGFDEFDPSIKEEYGYGVYENVITSLTFERFTHPTGPVEGEIIRPSDGKRPQRVVFVNCVGARDEQIGKLYCNKVCCMFSMKNARFLRLHEPHAEIYICYIDIRAAGKRFEAYYRTTMEQYGIKFVRGRVSEILEDPHTKDLTVRLENTEADEPLTLEKVDLVVLNCAFVPSKTASELINMLSLSLSEDKFIEEAHPNLATLETKIPGIYLVGVSHGPRDGADTIIEAKATASAATINLPPPTHFMKQPTIKEISAAEKPRVGVFVCHCGGIISSVIDVKKIAKEAVKEPNVEFSTDYLFMCSSPGQELIKEKIREHNLNRIVVASCTPMVHEKTFRDCVESVGLSRNYFVGPINIREQCAMVHQFKPAEATEKALDLVYGGIARVCGSEVVPIMKIDVKPSVLVIGGGISGICAAIDLAKKDLQVIIIERESKLGGRLNHLFKLFPKAELSEELLSKKLEELKNYKNIEIYYSTEITKLEGYIGNFIVTLNTNGTSNEINVGTIIVAAGTQVYQPELGEYGYGKTERVLTSLEFEKKMKAGEISELNTVAFIQCVGSRAYPGERGNPHCSRICCNVSIMLSEVIKEKQPSANIYILFKEHFRAFGRYMEENFIQIQKKGAKLIRWDKKNMPQVEIDENTGKVLVNVLDTFSKTRLAIPVDYVILSVGQEGAAGLGKLCEVLGITRSEDGFVEELHLKFKPVETRVPGIYTCASFPKDIADSIAAARGCASMVAIQQKGIELELITAEVDEELCVGCGLCESLCPYSAISMVELNPNKIVSKTTDVQCQGCGICVASCPVGARDLRWWRNDQIIAQIVNILKKERRK
ncbi:MAG TPA: CoB--CoM heterodisulfide reductase iron-sulfur subunit A family protein [Candidatus Deferrimicrobium sp.]|nr:CoB--CoM heterodisulfide reductase iron-sulfur subunit A family protein [Candidatus Deferrimicrobium sp.]